MCLGYFFERVDAFFVFPDGASTSIGSAVCGAAVAAAAAAGGVVVGVGSGGGENCGGMNGGNCIDGVCMIGIGSGGIAPGGGNGCVAMACGAGSVEEPASGFAVTLLGLRCGNCDTTALVGVVVCNGGPTVMSTSSMRWRTYPSGMDGHRNGG